MVTSNVFSRLELENWRRRLVLGGLDYGGWAQVIDSLENVIRENKRALEVNIVFLNTAIAEQSVLKKPGEVKVKVDA